MNKPYKYRKLTKKEAFDQRTMRYFFPRSNRLKASITHNDTIKMADISSRGIKPKVVTRGLKRLQWGKTYRDLQITQWRDDIMDGFITKYEIYQSVPEWMRLWIEEKLRYVPYDIEGKTSAMFVSVYHH